MRFKLGVEAGVNMELPDPDCYLELVNLVKKRVLKESQLDELVAPMLLWKFKLGLFDDPYVDPAEAERIVGCDEHRALARQSAREVITLLKNEGGLAPLDLSKYKTIAVIGPNADRTLLGGYSGVPKHEVTVLEGIKSRVGNRAKVLYSEGCKITIGGNWNQDAVVPSDPAEDRKQIAEAVIKILGRITGQYGAERTIRFCSIAAIIRSPRLMPSSRSRRSGHPDAVLRVDFGICPTRLLPTSSRTLTMS
jgi:beta-glucosidase